MKIHVPVLLKEVLEVLSPARGEFFIDGTLDGGGHAREVIKQISPGGKFLGIDWDKEMIERFKKNLKEAGSKTILINDNFKNMKTILEKENLGKADNVLLDLGFSSEQIENSGRGFSFQKDEPLIMTYSDEAKPVFKWLDDLHESEIAKIIKDFGEERFSGRIASVIKKNLPIKTTKKLRELIQIVLPRNYERGRINPATRTFQALRIFANQELENLKQFLIDLPNILNPGGRVAIISFHSLEDRIVKQAFRSLEKENRLEILTKKPIVVTKEEIFENPRSRSAKLRAAKII